MLAARERISIDEYGRIMELAPGAARRAGRRGRLSVHRRGRASPAVRTGRGTVTARRASPQARAERSSMLDLHNVPWRRRECAWPTRVALHSASAEADRFSVAADPHPFFTRGDRRRAVATAAMTGGIDEHADAVSARRLQRLQLAQSLGHRGGCGHRADVVDVQLGVPVMCSPSMLGGAIAGIAAW
jgi:hypothetical protein